MGFGRPEVLLLQGAWPPPQRRSKPAARRLWIPWHFSLHHTSEITVLILYLGDMRFCLISPALSGKVTTIDSVWLFKPQHESIQTKPNLGHPFLSPTRHSVSAQQPRRGQGRPPPVCPWRCERAVQAPWGPACDPQFLAQMPGGLQWVNA